jgi:hypothetical protein
VKRAPIKTESFELAKGGTLVVETFSYTLEEFIARNPRLSREEAMRLYYEGQPTELDL